jgi:sec-independent protein translocase protein TatB
MFGISLEHLLLIFVAGLFILGPQRLPELAVWLARTMRQIRRYSSNAREHVRAELGPEYDELRGYLQELRALRQVHPTTMVRDSLFGPTGSPVAMPPEPARNVVPRDGAQAPTPTNGADPSVTGAAPVDNRRITGNSSHG